MQTKTMKQVAANAAAKMLDLLARRHTAFKTFGEMVQAGADHSYSPTFACRWEERTKYTPSQHQAREELSILADAFDDAMEMLGSSSRAYRTNH